MGFPKVERLLINYKTLDEFKNLKGAEPRNYLCWKNYKQTLLKTTVNLHFTVFIMASLIARMSLYMKRNGGEPFEITYSYLELYKLEVLPTFQKQGFGQMLVNHAKQMQFPIKTIARIHSAGFGIN